MQLFLTHDASTVRQATSNLFARIVMRDKSIGVLQSFPLDHDTTKWQAREDYLLTLDATFRDLLKEHHEKHSKSILATSFLGHNDEFRGLLVRTFHRVELATDPTQSVFELRRIGTQLLSSLTVLTCWFDVSIMDEIWSKHEPTSFVVLDTLHGKLVESMCCAWHVSCRIVKWLETCIRLVV